MGQEKERAGVEVYSIDLDQWTQLQTAPRIQYMAACGLANKKIFMIGGWHTDTGTARFFKGPIGKSDI